MIGISLVFIVNYLLVVYLVDEKEKPQSAIKKIALVLLFAAFLSLLVVSVEISFKSQGAYRWASKQMEYDSVQNIVEGILSKVNEEAEYQSSLSKVILFSLLGSAFAVIHIVIKSKWKILVIIPLSIYMVTSVLVVIFGTVGLIFSLQVEPKAQIVSRGEYDSLICEESNSTGLSYKTSYIRMLYGGSTIKLNAQTVSIYKLEQGKLWSAKCDGSQVVEYYDKDKKIRNIDPTRIDKVLKKEWELNPVDGSYEITLMSLNKTQVSNWILLLDDQYSGQLEIGRDKRFEKPLQSHLLRYEKEKYPSIEYFKPEFESTLKHTPNSFNIMWLYQPLFISKWKSRIEISPRYLDAKYYHEIDTKKYNYGGRVNGQCTGSKLSILIISNSEIEDQYGNSITGDSIFVIECLQEYIIEPRLLKEGKSLYDTGLIWSMAVESDNISQSQSAKKVRIHNYTGEILLGNQKMQVENISSNLVINSEELNIDVKLSNTGVLVESEGGNWKEARLNGESLWPSWWNKLTKDTQGIIISSLIIAIIGVWYSNRHYLNNKTRYLFFGCERKTIGPINIYLNSGRNIKALKCQFMYESQLKERVCHVLEGTEKNERGIKYIHNTSIQVSHIEKIEKLKE